ncbi:claudin-4-like [Poecilia latipinna]|uniref:claudin-4-like n=1 Tax=Poecilia latipinna TaxID=48699 RepID=UPI00072E4EE7|nr:PREDICTED: claudin-4-like [Poecilia latipinna]
MASMGMQLVASALCLLGWAGVITSCALPMWSVTAFVGSSIVTSQTVWEGIWMTCVVQSTGQRMCKPYESQLALSADRQTARALMILAIVTGSFGLILAFVGGKCTRFLDDEGNEGRKEKVAIAGGVVLMITGLLCLIPTAWAAGTVVKNFYSAAIDAQKRELGACLYIGWGAAFLLILGGGLFMKSSCPGKAHDTDKRPSVRYVVVQSSKGSTRAGSRLTRVPKALAQPIKPKSPGPQSFVAPTANPQQLSRLGYDVESQQNMGEDSEKSWAPSTKSQMKRPESRKSEHSDAPSTKSQLKQAELDETLSAASENEEAAENPAKTYL